ncbi:hypothetical protein SAMN04515695_4788 [Pseudovibrio sp. Tun.PSC04-5.I4]|nr:hypothetical protein SAMN04515695_4788 [Pseudovibrio sp. Tun.PSC04-5.I4]
MARKPSITQAEMTRVIKAAKACGLTLHECVITGSETRLVFSKVDAGKASPQNGAPKPWPRQSA